MTREYRTDFTGKERLAIQNKRKKNKTTETETVTETKKETFEKGRTGKSNISIRDRYLFLNVSVNE